MRLHGFDAIRLVATKCTDRDGAAAWEAERAAALEAVDGGLFALDPPAPAGRPGAGHSHVAVAAPDRPPAEPAGPRRRADVRTDDWVRHGASVVVDPEAHTTGLIVAEVLPVDPAALDEWDRWYDDVHLPDMMECGAFARGTRWRRPVTRDGSANHLTVYEIAGPTVAEAVEASAAIMPGLIAAGRKHPSHAGGLTMALVRV